MASSKVFLALAMCFFFTTCGGYAKDPQICLRNKTSVNALLSVPHKNSFSFLAVFPDRKECLEPDSAICFGYGKDICLKKCDMNMKWDESNFTLSGENSTKSIAHKNSSVAICINGSDASFHVSSEHKTLDSAENKIKASQVVNFDDNVENNAERFLLNFTMWNEHPDSADCAYPVKFDPAYHFAKECRAYGGIYLPVGIIVVSLLLTLMCICCCPDNHDDRPPRKWQKRTDCVLNETPATAMASVENGPEASTGQGVPEKPSEGNVEASLEGVRWSKHSGSGAAPSKKSQ